MSKCKTRHIRAYKQGELCLVVNLETMKYWWLNDYETRSMIREVGYENRGVPYRKCFVLDFINDPKTTQIMVG